MMHPLALRLQIFVVWDGHEFGQHRSTEDGMVGGAEARDLERQVLRAKAILFVESDMQAYTTYEVCSLAEYDHVERFIASSHLRDVEKLLQHFSEDDVQAAAPVDEGLR
jgi:hypothetical protein